MTDCVVDASALVLAVSRKSDAAAVLRSRLSEARTHAPHLIDADVGNVLRRHELGGLLAPEEALAGLHAARALIAVRHRHDGPLAELAWRWRHNLSYYDALYVALAALLELPLLSADDRLSRAPHLPCAIEPVRVDLAPSHMGGPPGAGTRGVQGASGLIPRREKSMSWTGW